MTEPTGHRFVARVRCQPDNSIQVFVFSFITVEDVIIGSDDFIASLKDSGITAECAVGIVKDFCDFCDKCFDS